MAQMDFSPSFGHFDVFGEITLLNSLFDIFHFGFNLGFTWQGSASRPSELLSSLLSSASKKRTRFFFFVLSLSFFPGRRHASFVRNFLGFLLAFDFES
jgi:hypothetical protein